MFFRTKAERRPYHWGRFPLEVLPRDPHVAIREGLRKRPLAPGDVSEADNPLAQAALRYTRLFGAMATEEPARLRAPVPDTPDVRAIDAKGYGYFLDATQIGICRLTARSWLPGEAELAHDYGLVLLVEHGRIPEADNLLHAWAKASVATIATMRATEIAVCIARHFRLMGFDATAHCGNISQLYLDRVAVLAGLCVRTERHLEAPYLGRRFAVAAVSTDYRMAVDKPLAPSALGAGGLAYWWGQNGATSGRERRRQAARKSHLSRYPMEQVRRVERPTTRIDDDQVPRVPKRAAFFERALRGDLGEKAKTQRSRFALKHPASMAMAGPIRAMVPLQDGPLGDKPGPWRDPATNARAIKSLSYMLGADLTGICEIPRYAWFSHKEDGSPIEPYHRYAVVMLIDQEYDTMEGASGDDWISGAQSMRGYLRGAEIAGIMAETVRASGYGARAQTNLDSDVLHIPLILWAGLGELSRIGELVLNPFVGPRFKSVVFTTDLPLEVDRPIDFGLQYFCSNCWKCARECPCDAIPLGGKVMFNGYEMWKPDVERCTRYRLTNVKGSACGRCMKTCPLNKVVSADGPLLTRVASWLGINAMWLKPLLVPIAVRMDDWLGLGRRNLIKKWWFDLEIVDGVCVKPEKGVNRRDIDPSKPINPTRQKIAYYPASAMPPADQGDAPFPLDRKAALATDEVKPV